ncbi:MAG TPA: helix-turn-helix domain-containing protein [Candidatus Limnocylindria bacterium]|nr:helix-turn-helix domain-containing protein [Candidatus Limnocylindria bacterium]
MPKLLFARPPQDEAEERHIRRLARSRHAPGDWIVRARMIAGSWDGLRTTAIAAELGCHPQTVRERLVRFNAAGLEGLGDRPGAGRKPRLTEEERSRIIAVTKSEPPGRLVWDGHRMVAPRPEEPAHWSLDALAEAAQARGIRVSRSQIRRILQAEGVRWRATRSWAESTDPEFVPKGPRSSPATPTHRPGRRSSASTNWGR